MRCLSGSAEADVWPLARVSLLFLDRFLLGFTFSGLHSAAHVIRTPKLPSGIDIDGILRGKFMSPSKFRSAAKSSFGFCSVIFGWDGFTDTSYSPSSNLSVCTEENGFHDIGATIDWATYRRLPWERDAPFFLVSFKDPATGEPLHACPRSMLEVVMRKVREQGGDAGWEGMAGAEFEVGEVDAHARVRR